MTDTDEKTQKRKNWVTIPGEKDIFFNLVCKKCGSIVSRDNFYISDENPKLYCNNCGPGIMERGQHLIEKKIEDITRDFACNILNNNKTTKFINGRNLYVNFLIMIHNYRQKVDFCNF